MAAKPDLTLDDDLVLEFAEAHLMAVHRVSVWRSLRSLGLTHKIDLQAVEQKRPEVRQARHIWITRRQPFMANLLPRIGFIDETPLKTNMAKTNGWSPKGTRLIDHAPFGHRNTQTFIAALRHDRLDAPWVINGAMNRKLFELYVETQLVPTLQPGDVIILDNLSSHKSPKASGAMRAVGAMIRRAAARTYDYLWRASVTSVIFSLTRNATTFSGLLDMKPIERNAL